MFSNLFSHESATSTTAKAGIGAALLAVLVSPDGLAYLGHVVNPTYAPLVIAFVSALAGRATVPPK